MAGWSSPCRRTRPTDSGMTLPLSDQAVRRDFRRHDGSTAKDVCILLVLIGTVVLGMRDERQGAVAEDLLRVVRELVRGADARCRRRKPPLGVRSPLYRCAVFHTR